MSELLLPYLFPKFRIPKEDIVTLALCHILDASEAMNKTFTEELCKKLRMNTLSGIRYRPQVTGKNQERPDITGTNSDGSEMLLCEAKFFAGLTSNQPTGYLNRLIGRLNTGLIFICPESRINSLWKQLLSLIDGYETIDDKCVSIHGVHMSIIGWDDLLGDLFQTAKSCDPNVLADLNQLEGLCRKLEDIDFMPFSDDDLSVSTAKNIDRYYMVIDDIIHCLLTQKEFHASVKGAHSAGLWGGYNRYGDIWKLGIGLGFSTANWKANASEATPFWVWFYYGNNNELHEAVDHLIASVPERYVQVDKKGHRTLALIPPTDIFREDIAKELTSQVLQYVRKIKEYYDILTKSEL